MKEKRYFEWIYGDDAGKVVELEYIDEFEGEVFYHFDDGEACNLRYISPITDVVSDLKEKVIVEVESRANVWTFDVVKARTYKDESMTEAIEIPTLHDVVSSQGQREATIDNSNLGSQILVPPRVKQRKRALPKIENWSNTPAPAPVAKPKPQTMTEEPKPVKKESLVPTEPVETKAVANIEVASKPEFPNNPVAILVDSCKKKQTKVNMSLMMDLPSPDIYRIAKEDFENGDEKFIDRVVSGLGTELIIDALKSALKESYESHMGSEKTNA